MDEQEEIIVDHIEEFAACVEVEDLFRRNLPTTAPTHEAGEIVLWTSARSHRTFKVMVKVCKLGYALEAAKLNRVLFEDMVSAHWAARFPSEAVKRIAEHGEYTHVLRAELKRKAQAELPRPATADIDAAAARHVGPALPKGRRLMDRKVGPRNGRQHRGHVAEA